jgi:hypothetical protein
MREAGPVTSGDPSEGPAIGGYTREQLRQSYADAWRKYLASAPLTPLECLITDVIARHPEYHSAVEDLSGEARHEAVAADPLEKPFLHMGLHIAVREQIAIDRPPGIRDLHHALRLRLGDEHAADHALMDALAETLWEAQRGGRPPDEKRYLELARRGAARER